MVIENNDICYYSITINKTDTQILLQNNDHSMKVLDSRDNSEQDEDNMENDVKKKIEDELDYPGQIKVTVVREFRTTEIAK